MPASFNLITRPWIPAMPKKARSPIKVGLEQLLVESHDYSGIYGSTPLEVAAIYRLLLAVLHSAWNVTDTEWQTIWRQGHFERSVVEDYLKKWLPRFDLFDARRPFYQDAALDREPESVSSLMAHIASGADATLFSHNTRINSIVLKSDEAARSLIAIQAFGLCGTKGKGTSFADAPCARGVVFYVEGSTLFDTLMFNLFDRDLPENRLKRRADDRPSWEQDDPFAGDPRRPYGLLDHLTWHNRRIRLIPEAGESSENLVRQMMYAPGLKTSDAKGQSVRDVFNPFHYWRANPKKTKSPDDEAGRSHSPIYFDQDRALWRDSTVLMRLSTDGGDEQNKPPSALNWMRDLANAGVLSWSNTYRCVAFGASTEPGQDKTFFYRAEALPLPLCYLDPNNTEWIEKLEGALALAKQTESLLHRATLTLARLILNPKLTNEALKSDPRKEERERVQPLSTSWGTERYFWSGLELHFYRLVQDLPVNSPAALKAWRAQLRRAARAAFKQAEDYAGADRRAQRAIVRARDEFDFGLRRILTEPNEADSTNGGENQ